MENGHSRKQTSGTSKENEMTEDSKTAQTSTIIQEADDFIDKWTSGEIVVNYERANVLESTTEAGKNFWGKPKKLKHQFCNDLGFLIARYQLHRDIDTAIGRYEAAFNLMMLVQKGWAFGALKDVKQQTRDHEQESERLKEQNDALRKLNDKLAIENKRLRNLLPNVVNKQKGDTEIGDVGK
jgi:hypothetical protein